MINDKRYKNRELRQYINMFFPFDIVISPQSHVARVFPVSLQDFLHVISQLYTTADTFSPYSQTYQRLTIVQPTVYLGLEPGLYKTHRTAQNFQKSSLQPSRIKKKHSFFNNGLKLVFNTKTGKRRYTYTEMAKIGSTTILKKILICLLVCHT